MKTIKICRLTGAEQIELLKEIRKEELETLRSVVYDADGLPEENDRVITLSNKTLTTIRAIKNVYKWKDIEDMVKYVAIIDKLDTDEETVDLDDDQVKLVIKVFKGTANDGLLAGQGLEQIVEIYKTFL